MWRMNLRRILKIIYALCKPKDSQMNVHTYEIHLEIHQLKNVVASEKVKVSL